MANSAITVGVALGATQSDQETGTSTTTTVTPGKQHFHNSAAKAWANITYAGTPSLSGSYNVTSVADTAIGRIGVTLTTAFSDSSYAVSASCTESTNTVRSVAMVNSKSTSSFEIHVESGGTTPSDGADGVMLCAFGDL